MYIYVYMYVYICIHIYIYVHASDYSLHNQLKFHYGAPFLRKLVTFTTPILIFVRQRSIFCVTQNFFNQYNIYLYATRTIFCQHLFLYSFCNTKLYI